MAKTIKITFYNPKELWSMFWNWVYWPRRKQCAECLSFLQGQLEYKIVNGLFLASVYSPKYTNAAENPIDHLHSVLCDFDFNIVFDPRPEYAKVVNYPYSKLIGYNGTVQLT